MSDRKPVASSVPRRATVDSPPYHSLSSSVPRLTDARPYPHPIPRRRSTIHHDVNSSRPLPPSMVHHQSHSDTPPLSWSTSESPETNDIYNFHFNASPFSMSVPLPSTSGNTGSNQPRITSSIELDNIFRVLPPSTVSSPDPTYYPDMASQAAIDNERLREQVRELELENDAYRRKIEEAWERMREPQQNQSNSNMVPGLFPSHAAYHPNPHIPNPSLGPQPADWSRRTEARIRRFCALNRAGNALCAWHDSRRERRRYPPRNAPDNTLNCGCTYEQALFEESLARHQVGSYLPGENVRMDPALRNALLRLLEDTYGYRDGDFERLLDGSWRQGEDASSWEQKATMRPPRRDR